MVIFGAGTAGAGIADEIVKTFVRFGLTEDEARKRFWLIDRPGLLVDGMESLAEFQKPYARDKDEVAEWNAGDHGISLSEVVKRVKPTILIGCSTVA